MRVAGLLLTGCLLTGCISEPVLTTLTREPLPPLPSVAPEDMFAKAIEEVCFAAVAGNRTPFSLIEEAGFTEFAHQNSAYLAHPTDTLYSAADVTSPVLVSLTPHEPRCDVVAVSGDPATLKLRAEDIMLQYDETRPDYATHYLAFAQTAPQGRYALRFSLLFGELVGDEAIMRDYGDGLPVLTSQDGEIGDSEFYVD